MTSGANLTLPIIDTRGYTDQIADIHTRIRTFMFLDRLGRANRTIANQVLGQHAEIVCRLELPARRDHTHLWIRRHARRDRPV